MKKLRSVCDGDIHTGASQMQSLRPHAVQGDGTVKDVLRKGGFTPMNVALLVPSVWLAHVEHTTWPQQRTTSVDVCLLHRRQGDVMGRLRTGLQATHNVAPGFKPMPQCSKLGQTRMAACVPSLSDLS